MTKTFHAPLVERLQDAGFELVRHSKHEVYKNPHTGATVSFSTDIRDKNMANRILKAAKLEGKKL